MEDKMKTVATLGVLILAVLFHGAALAKTQVLFSGVVGADVPLNVSNCAQIRVTASIPKGSSDPGAVFLWDESAPNTALLAAPLVIGLPSGGGYNSISLDTPGLTLAISGYGGVTAVVYCRS